MLTEGDLLLKEKEICLWYLVEYKLKSAKWWKGTFKFGVAPHCTNRLISSQTKCLNYITGNISNFLVFQGSDQAIRLLVTNCLIYIQVRMVAGWVLEPTDILDARVLQIIWRKYTVYEYKDACNWKNLHWLRLLPNSGWRSNTADWETHSNQKHVQRDQSICQRKRISRNWWSGPWACALQHKNYLLPGKFIRECSKRVACCHCSNLKSWVGCTWDGSTGVSILSRSHLTHTTSEYFAIFVIILDYRAWWCYAAELGWSERWRSR